MNMKYEKKKVCLFVKRRAEENIQTSVDGS